jgi:hypothetical protein
MVFGAGELEPLEEFEKAFSEIVFVDHDQPSLDAAKKRVPKATCHCLDLTGKVRKSFESIVHEVVNSRKSIPEGIAEVIDVLNNSNSEDLLQFKEFGKFDYVVSSLIATQIADNVLLVVQDYFKSFLATDLLQNPEYIQARGKFGGLCIRSHIIDITNLSKGNVYFSETVIQFVDGKPLKMIPDELLEGVKKVFKVEQDWDWAGNNPKAPFKVRAFLITAPEATAAATPQTAAAAEK